MAKTFEDYFADIQKDMISICWEYTEYKAENVFIYCYMDSSAQYVDYFFYLNGAVKRKHKLNEGLGLFSSKFDVSINMQKQVQDILYEDLQKIIRLFNQYQREIPVEIKIVYDSVKKKAGADYKYADAVGPLGDRIPQQFFDEWVQQVEAEG